MNAIGAQLVTVNGPPGAPRVRPAVAFEVIAGYTWRDPRGASWRRSTVRNPRKPIHVALVVDPAGQGTAMQARSGRAEHGGLEAGQSSGICLSRSCLRRGVEQARHVCGLDAKIARS